MALSPEQIEQIKKQVIEQIETTFPEEKKSSAIQRIESMDDKQLTEFLKQNKLIKENTETPAQQCIFCSIIKGEIPSTRLDENEKSIAILELNPLSEGHTIIIPKKHSDIIPIEAEELAKQIKEKIKTTLKPKDVLIENGNIFGHGIINIIPVYGDALETKRKKTTPEELAKTKEKILSAPEIKKEPKEPKEEITDKNTWLPKQIP